jgi:predicted LPLAT superfamily acyltransferase
VRSILDEQDTTVVVNDHTASRTTATLTLDAMSRATVAPCDVFASAGEAAALAPDASVGVLVTGGHRPFIQVQRALAQFEVEVIKVAIVIDPDETVGIRRVGNLTLLSVRELADLRRVLFSGALA